MGCLNSSPESQESKNTQSLIEKVSRPSGTMHEAGHTWTRTEVKSKMKLQRTRSSVRKTIRMTGYVTMSLPTTSSKDWTFVRSPREQINSLAIALARYRISEEREGDVCWPGLKGFCNTGGEGGTQCKASALPTEATYGVGVEELEAVSCRTTGEWEGGVNTTVEREVSD